LHCFFGIFDPAREARWPCFRECRLLRIDALVNERGSRRRRGWTICPNRDLARLQFPPDLLADISATVNVCSRWLPHLSRCAMPGAARQEARGAVLGAPG